MRPSVRVEGSLTFAALGCLLVGLAQAEPARPQIAVRPMATPPTIDGQITEAEWAGAVRSVGLCSQHDMALAAREAIFWVGADKTNLYIALRTELPPMGELLTRAVPDEDRDVIAALSDDSVELVVHPHLGETMGDQRYFHLIVNARGALFDRFFDPANPQNPVSTAWRIRNWQYQSRQADGWWDVEIAIPFTEIGATTKDLRHSWGLRVCRNWQRGWDQSRWESVSAAYEDVPTMPLVSFDEHAPVVQVLGLRGEKAPRIELAVGNPGDEPLAAKLFISDTWSHNPPAELTREVLVPAGGREVVVFEPPHPGPEGIHRTILRVTSPDEQRLYYLRDFTWRFERPAERWEVVREEARAVKLQFKAYPYYHKLKARVDVSALASRDDVVGGVLTVTHKQSGTRLLVSNLDFRNYVSEAVWDVEWREGDYEISAAPMLRDGTLLDPVVAMYERRVFPWERNNLGKSQRVIPPFTPILVQGRTLSTVLREHVLNGAGLWDQVVSLGRPLLNAPMRWIVRSGEREFPVTPGTLSVPVQRADLAVTEAGFTAGPLQARVSTQWEQDGMAKVTLVLGANAYWQQDTGGAPVIDRLSLDIPLDDAQMPYMHASGDGLRFNFAGRRPAGEGAFWNSSQANRTNFVGTFYPYLWLGGGERGLAWFADSDKGWSLDETTPTIQLERADGTLTMRVNFVTRPTSLEEPREIVFGLQATPAKPMPEEPVNWRRWICAYVDEPRVQPFNIVGSSYYYGCLGFDFYPRDHDLSIYEAFSAARDSGTYNGEFVDRWMEGYKPQTEPGSEQWDFLLAHIRAGMHAAAGTPRSRGWLWTPYTNPRGMGFHMAEWPTFQDEWVNFPYLDRAKVGGLAYEITPVESFQDAAMWYY